MKYFILGLFLLICMTLFSCVQNNKKECTVQFIVDAPGLGSDHKIYLTGNHQKLGKWEPAKIQMIKISDVRFVKSIRFDKNSDIEFKFTLGSWATEALDKSGNRRENEFATIHSDTIIHLDVKHWKKTCDDQINGQITGELRYHQHFKIKGIPDRNISVCLPSGYNDDSLRSYPVLYMQDGQNCFDPKTSSFGVDWQIDETCSRLIAKGKIKKIIVVGMNNTANRSLEYVPGKDANIYMNLVVNKIKPFIDSEYRTKPDRLNTAVGGSSAGGTISFMLLWEYPEVFSKAICMSPAFKIEDINYVKTVRNAQRIKTPFFVYIDNGGVGLEKKLQPGVDEMIQALKEKGYENGKDYYWLKDSTAQHNESAWAKRFPKAIELLFGKENK